MKKNYLNAEIEIVNISERDVIATSITANGDNDADGSGAW